MLQETDIVMVIDSTYRSLRLQGTNENGCGDLARYATRQQNAKEQIARASTPFQFYSRPEPPLATTSRLRSGWLLCTSFTLEDKPNVQTSAFVVRDSNQ